MTWHHGVVLSPLYDVNPIPYGNELSLNVDATNNSINIELALQTALKFGITRSDAESFAEEILTIVGENWKKLASFYGLSLEKQEEMRPAFSACI